MVRYEFDDGPIKIAYGSDDITSGLFLSVYDQRLEWQTDATDEVNGVSKGIDGGVGGGCYLSLCTGLGIGKKVSAATIKVYMERYGVPKEQMLGLFGSVTGTTSADECSDKDSSVCNESVYNLSESFSTMMPPQEADHESSTTVTVAVKKGKNKKKKSGSKATAKNTSTEKAKKAEAETETETESTVDGLKSGKCIRCGKLTKMHCAKCRKNSDQTIYYCSKDCQVADWPVHKHLCSLQKPPKMFPKMVGAMRSVYGIILPEMAAKPCIVDVIVERKWDDEDREFYWTAKYDEFLGESGSTSYITQNPLKPNRSLPNYFTIHYRDCFLTDGSMPNKCVQAITGGQAGHDWRGPLVILKCQGYGTDLSSFNPIDIEPVDDFVYVIDYFKSYVSQNKDEAMKTKAELDLEL